MKIKLTFKSPDAVDDAMTDAGISRRENPDEYDALYGELAEWIRYGEYLGVEYDTETKQMVVLKND
jgi:hypothetical protein